jgi:hypothetical protein
MTDTAVKASPGELRAFFEAGGARKVTSAELMALKKHVPDDPATGRTQAAAGAAYDEIAVGIGNGTLTY